MILITGRIQIKHTMQKLNVTYFNTLTTNAET